MTIHYITPDHFDAFTAYLRSEEQAAGTIEKYTRDLRSFSAWLCGRAVDKEAVTAWREHLQAVGYAAVTINSKLAALHSFFRLVGWQECRVKYVNVQKRLFRDQSRELERDDYGRLVATAAARKDLRLALLTEAICSTGVRVSEVRYLTVEAARAGRTDVRLKGKVRTILPRRLFAASCWITRRKRKSPPVRSSSLEAGRGWTAGRSGRK